MRIILQLILIGLIVFLTFSCSNIESEWNCFGASSPVDLTIINNDQSDKIVTFYLFDKQKGYERIGTIQLNENSDKTICLETEGQLQNGLYIYHNKKTHKIFLNWPNEYILNLNDSSNLIETPKTLEYLLDPKP